MRFFRTSEILRGAATLTQPFSEGRGLPRRCILLGLLFTAAVPAQACVRVAEVPLRLVDGFPVVGASLAGRSVSFVVDTGAQGMLVTPGIAEMLGLPLSGLTRVFGTGGSQAARVVGLPGLRLGGAAMAELSAPVLALPVALEVAPPLAGLLGASLLSRFDLEFDLPGGRMALWAPGDCAMPRGTVLPLEVSRAGEAFVPVRVNGQSLLALVDSGSRATILSEAVARRLGVSAPASANTAPGVDGVRLPVGHTRVRLGLGDEAAVEVPVSVAPLQLDRGDMLLGLDQLGRRRVWVLYGRGVAVFGG